MNSHRVQCVIVLGQADGYILATRSFAVAGPKTWNSLPTSGGDSTLTLKQLQSRLRNQRTENDEAAN